MASEFGSLVVCDAGPLIHLDELSCFGLLNQFDEILVPEVVWREVERHRPSALRRRRVHLQRVEVFHQASPALLAALDEYPLDLGEEEAVRLMEHFPGATLLTDDGQARAVAQMLRFDVHGTIGVLILAFKQGWKTKRQTINLLRAIPRKSTLHVTRRFLEQIVQEMQETGS